MLKACDLKNSDACDVLEAASQVCGVTANAQMRLILVPLLFSKIDLNHQLTVKQ